MTQISQSSHTNLDFGNFSEACNIFIPRTKENQPNAFAAQGEIGHFPQMHELTTPKAFHKVASQSGPAMNDCKPFIPSGQMYVHGTQM